MQRLLATRGGDYAAACSLDFSKPPAFYDTFALRDSEGYAAVMQSWPYFRSRASRDALKASQPVPVTSCWNGIGKITEQSYLAGIFQYLDICRSHDGRIAILRLCGTASAVPWHLRLIGTIPPGSL